MMNNTPSGAKKHHENTKPEIRQMAKMFSSSSSSDMLVQICATLSQGFSHKTAATHRRTVCHPLDCPPHILLCQPGELNQWLCKFVLEIQRKMDNSTHLKCCIQSAVVF